MGVPMRPTPIQPIFCAVFDILETPVELVRAQADSAGL